MQGRLFQPCGPIRGHKLRTYFDASIQAVSLPPYERDSHLCSNALSHLNLSIAFSMRAS